MPDGHTDSTGQGQGWQQPEKQSKSPHWPLVCRVQLGTPLFLVLTWMEENPTTPQPRGHLSSLSPSPYTATTTGPTDTDFPPHGEDEEVPEEEGFPSAHSGCRVSRILAGATAWHCQSHLPSRFREEGMQQHHSSALEGVSTERSPHCEPRGAAGKIKPKICHQRSPHDLPWPDLPSSRPANPLPSACSSPGPFRGPC